ncbi:CARDB domain-containing protein [uncultured Clostridium sp.]|uniref:COG1361 S-layer family protein n=1 Tax=uncultured Clostridium sp. TaxID=59620 RepID=UPI0025F22B56|nr:CARDB domain-containing protein [uncultured Clostridium sp.]
MKKWKRVPVIALIVVLLAMMGTQVATAEMLDMNQFNDDTITVSKVPKGKAGNKISIKMTIHNKGTKGDNDLKKIRLANSYEYERIMERQFGEADDSDEGELRWYDKSFPFEADSTTFKEKDINVKPGSSKSVTLSYKLRRDLTAGYYQAFFIIDDSIEVGVNIWVSAYDGSTEEDDNTKLDYDFAIGENQFTPSASYSQVMNFGVNLRNSGLKKVYDVRVDMQLDPDITKFPFDINEGNYLRYMGDMDPEQTVTVPYSMAVREEVKSGFFPIHYKISYREESGGDFIDPVDKVFYVRVVGKDEDELSADAGEEDRTKARIIVDSFSTVPDVVFAGQPFELHVTMKNASSNVTSSNIMFTFASEEVESSPVFTSDTGSTSVVVNQLAPGATTDLKMTFKSSPTAGQKSYTMTIKEQYDSPEFKNAKEEVKISIPIKQEPRLNTGTIEVMPDSINVGSETNVMFGINNTGKVLLYNVMARFEADSIQTTDAYVGNIKPGETGNVDTMVTGVAPTEDDGKVKIIISYEDENGLATEIEKEMMLYVNEASDDFGDMEAGNIDGMEGMDGMEGEQTFFGKYKMVIFPAAALIIIIAATTVIVIRKKKKAAQEEGMDDEIL